MDQQKERGVKKDKETLTAKIEEVSKKLQEAKGELDDIKKVVRPASVPNNSPAQPTTTNLTQPTPSDPSSGFSGNPLKSIGQFFSNSASAITNFGRSIIGGVVGLIKKPFLFIFSLFGYKGSD